MAALGNFAFIALTKVIGLFVSPDGQLEQPGLLVPSGGQLGKLCTEHSFVADLSKLSCECPLAASWVAWHGSALW